MNTQLNAKTTEGLSIKTKVCYSVTETGLLLVAFMFSSQLLFFMTDFLGISAAAAGMMFLVTRIWDAINDPIVGIIADRNKSRYGKCRPFILIGGIPVVISLVLSFTKMNFSPMGSLIYIYFMYTLFGMAYTTIFVPSTSMIGKLATNPRDRSSLSATKGAFQAGGVLFAAILTVPLIIWLGGTGEMNAQGFQSVAAIYAAIALTLFCFTFFTVREKNTMTENSKAY